MNKAEQASYIAAGHADKLTKTQAGYKEGKHHCGVCVYYEPNSCKVVGGRIDPDDGCLYFKRKPGASTRYNG